ncbi:MAG: GlsB/YeaQ/YmgE family stress response membrane protein [Mesorhizobium sp.]
MGIISWIILGAIAGFIGSKIVNKTGQGIIMDIALGIVGAIVGGVICSQIFGVGITGLNIYSLIVAVAGAVIVLWAYHKFSGNRTL